MGDRDRLDLGALFDRRNRTEVASGLAGTSVARQQGSQDILNELRRPSTAGGFTPAGVSFLDLRNQQIAGGADPSPFGRTINPRSSLGQDPSLGLGGAFDAQAPVLQQPTNRRPTDELIDSINFITGGRTASGIADELNDKRVQGSDLSRLATGLDRERFHEDILTTAFDRKRNEFLAAQDAAVAQVTGAYRDRIGDLQKELAGYRGGLGDVNAAYSAYATDANAILEEAAAVEADPLPESGVVAEVGDNFDIFEGAMQDTLQKIAGNGDEALAVAMGKEVRWMEDAITDGIRSGVLTQDEMHGLAAAEASALSHMAWKDDAYQAEKSRFTLEVQIKQAIDDKQQAILVAQRDMNRAIANTKSQFGEFELSPDELWTAAMDDYFASTEMNDLDRNEIIARWRGIQQNNPQAFANYESFSGEVYRQINEGNLAKVGLLDEVDRYLDAAIASGNEDVVRQIETALTNPQSIAGMRQLTALIRVNPNNPLNEAVDKIDWGRLETADSPHVQATLDLWSHYDDYTQNYDKYVSNLQAQSDAANNYRGSQAPNNAQNKNQPDYVYRRNVTAPYFATTIKDLFPGTEIGALGYIRPPSNVGGGKAKNSDHQSGGAIDVYSKGGTPAQSDAELTRIANWARNTPGISLVVYEGNSAHQKHGSTLGHVHISFDTNFRVP